MNPMHDEIVSLNAEHLDVEELEQRLELAIGDAFLQGYLCGADCGTLTVCGADFSGCGTLTVCGANCSSNFVCGADFGGGCGTDSGCGYYEPRDYR